MKILSIGISYCIKEAFKAIEQHGTRKTHACALHSMAAVASLAWPVLARIIGDVTAVLGTVLAPVFTQLHCDDPHPPQRHSLANQS